MATVQKPGSADAAIVNAGILGAGLMGRWHADAIRRAGGRIGAVCDLNRDAAQGLGRQYGGADVHIARELTDIEQQGIDVWHICTPPATHYALAMAVIAAGRHALVEKPLAATADETNAILAAATAGNVLVNPVHQFPFQVGAQTALAQLPKLGRLVSMHYVARSAGGQGLSQSALAALALEILPHPLSLLATFRPDALQHMSWQAASAAAGELSVTGTTGNINFTIAISLAGRPTANRCEIVTTGSTIALNLFHGYALVETGMVSRRQKILQPFNQAARQSIIAGINLARRFCEQEPAYPGLRSLVQAFYAAIRGQAPPPIPEQTIRDIALARDQISNLLPRSA